MESLSATGLALELTEPGTVQQQRLNRLLQLAGLSLFLATIEILIPKPMPFLKLGIANLPILLFVRQLHYRELLLLVLLKVFCQSLISGTMLSYILVFSACASFASSTAMWLLARIPVRHVSLLGISILGAASSNGVQLVLALTYFFPGTGSLLIPWSLTFGLGSGVLLGLFALQFRRISHWHRVFHVFLQQSYTGKTGHSSPANQSQANKPLPKISIQNHIVDAWQTLRGFGQRESTRRFSFGILSLLLMFAINKYEGLYLGAELLLFLLLNRRLGYRPWWRSMLLLFGVIIFFHLLLPSGRVLWEWNWAPYIHWKVTQGALERGIGKAFFLLNLIQISRFAVSRELRLPGLLGHIVQRVFAYYEGFLNCPVVFRGLKPLLSLDRILCYLSGLPDPLAESGKVSSGSWPEYQSEPKSKHQAKQSATAKPAARAERNSWQISYFVGALLLQGLLLAAAVYWPFYLLQERWLG